MPPVHLLAPDEGCTLFLLRSLAVCTLCAGTVRWSLHSLVGPLWRGTFRCDHSPGNCGCAVELRLPVHGDSDNGRCERWASCTPPCSKYGSVLVTKHGSFCLRPRAHWEASRTPHLSSKPWETSATEEAVSRRAPEMLEVDPGLGRALWLQDERTGSSSTLEWICSRALWF